MASRKVRYEFESKNFQAVDATFDKLTKKEQEAIVKGSKLGHVLEETGKKAKKVTKEAGNEFQSMATNMLGAITAGKLLSKAIESVNSQMETLASHRQKSEEKQRTYAESIGSIADNMRTTFTPKKREGIERFIKDQGKLLGEGGIGTVANALADVTSLMGTTDFTEDEIKKAVAYQVSLKAAGLPVDIAAGASANMDVARQAGITNRQAENMIATFGEQAGGTAATFSPIVPSILATGQSVGMKPSEAMALAGFISQELKEDPASTATIVKNLIGKTDPLRLQKLGITLEADSRFLQIIEVMKRAQSGEFGAEKFKVLTAAGVKGAHAPGVSYKVAQKSESLLRREAEITRNKESAIDFSKRTGAALGTQARVEAVGKRIKGGEEVVLSEDVEANIRAKHLDLINKLGTKYGFTPHYIDTKPIEVGRGQLSESEIKSILDLELQPALGFDIDQLGLTKTQKERRESYLEDRKLDKDLKLQISELVNLMKEERGKVRDDGGQ